MKKYFEAYFQFFKSKIINSFILKEPQKSDSQIIINQNFLRKKFQILISFLLVVIFEVAILGVTASNSQIKPVSCFSYDELYKINPDLYFPGISSTHFKTMSLTVWECSTFEPHADDNKNK